MPQVIAVTFIAAVLWGMVYMARQRRTRRRRPPGMMMPPWSAPRQPVKVVALLTDNRTVLIGYIPVDADTDASSGIAIVDPSAYGAILLELPRDDTAVLDTLQRWCRIRATVSFGETESGWAVEMRERFSSTRLVLSGPLPR
jgi:hypothetical protein